MDNKDEVLLTSLLFVSLYLCNTNRVPNAIDMCKEVLFLLQHKTLGNIGEKCVKRFENIRSHAIGCGIRPILTSRQVVERKVELMTTQLLARLYKSESKYNQAKGLDLKALKIAEKVGDITIKAKCSGHLEHLKKALALEYLGEYVKAKEHSEKALAIAEKIGDRKIEAICYANLGRIFKSLGEHVKAKEHCEKALAIAEKNGDGEIKAICYECLGSIFESQGEYVKAEEHSEKALAIAEKIGDRKIEATCYASLGSIFESLGEYVKAKEHCEKTIAIAEKIGDRKIEATCYVSLGSIFKSQGEYVKAKKHSEKALTIAEKIGDRKIEAICYASLGSIFEFLGEDVKAKEHFEKALAIAEKIGHRNLEADCYVSVGSIFVSQGEYVKAKEHSEKGLAIAEKTGERKIEAKCYAILGSIFESQGEYVKAKEHHEKALAIAEKIGDRKTEARCCVFLGVTFESLGEDVKSKEWFENACVLFKKYGNIQHESLLYLHIAARMFSKGNISEAKSSFNNVEVMRRLQVHDKSKISYFDRIFSGYRKLSQFLCDKADFSFEAFYTEEFGRARALTDLMAALYSVENEIPVSPETWDDVQSIVKKECNCSCLYISYFEQLIHLWVVKADKPLIFRQIKGNDVSGSASRVADLLCRDIYREVLCLAPEQCEDRSWLPSNAYSEQGCERPMLEEDEVVSEQPELTVYKTIIAPVADYLDEPEIIILPDHVFYKVPFAALEDESGKCLSESYRIRIVPSLTTLKLIQDSPPDYHSQTGVLIVGDPDVGDVLYEGILKRVSRLSFANKEAMMIGNLFGTQPLLGKQATKQAVLQNIHSVSLIHFACHGNAERGEILLAPPPLTDRKPQEEDYLLTMENISKVQLRAKLVVLSCCHSAKGQISAEGVVGIARAFLGSGARSVLAALWAIEDEATEEFMSRFYENLLRGESASESLQLAMKWMRGNGFSKVSQWAPFMLIGDNVTLDIHKLKDSERTLEVDEQNDGAFPHHPRV